MVESRRSEEGAAPRRRLVTIVGPLLVGLLAGLYFYALRPEDADDRLAALEERVTELGFSARPPLCRLSLPGMLFVRVAENANSVGIVCAMDDASREGILEDCVRIDGVDLSELRSGRAEFSTSAAGLFSGELGDDVAVALRVRNLRALELPTEKVLGLRESLGAGCIDAARFHTEGGEQLSVVTAVLIGDVEYRVTTESGIGFELTEEMLAELETSGTARIERVGDSSFRAEGMVLGLRDHPRMARFIADPQLQGAGSLDGASDESFLPERLAWKAYEIEPGSFVALDVEPLQQPTGMSCWAAVAAMLEGWRSERAPDVERLVESLPAPLRATFEEDRGLEPATQAALVDALGLRAEAPQNFTPEGYRALLERHGPLWVSGGGVFSPHVRLLYGTFTDRVTGEPVYLLIDPATGERVIESMDTFHANFEREAAEITGADLALELRWQVLHFE